MNFGSYYEGKGIHFNGYTKSLYLIIFPQHVKERYPLRDRNGFDMLGETELILARSDFSA